MKLLDTTLRDGSYAINFQFTARDTAVIGAELEKAGLELIEIGHGVGLRASELGMGRAAETDEAYLKAAADSIKKAKWGMFCIPGIAKLEDVDLAAEYKMGFIRIGTNVGEVEKSEAFIARAKKHGMYVCSNFMKSYTLEPKKFAEQAKLSRTYGADLVCVVDSAGGMLQGELESYFRAVQAVCDVPLGFHGHDNLGLAVANSLRAVELGAAVVDSSLQGMGRSAGNAATENLVAALKRSGRDAGVDLLKVLDIGEKYIKPLIRRRGLGSLDVIAGYALFHSSYMGLIRRFSSKYRVDPRKLIIEVCAVDLVSPSAELVESVAKKLKPETDEVYTAKYDFDEYYGEEQLKKPA
ncbi:MAG: 4-hydroxy-2-oxovalerate aldolase [Elusimicrobia bacterium]|nr:4-hydroxy-2-oxovalerate aldolase [Elusimicrobiota bacterium]